MYSRTAIENCGVTTEKLSSLFLSHLFQESSRCLTPGERSETDSAQSPETLRERNTPSPALLCKALVNVVSEPRAQRNSTDSSVWVESVLSLTTQLCHITIPMVSSRTAQCYIKWRKTSAIEFYWLFFLQLYCVKFILGVGFKSCCRVSGYGDLI